MLRFSTGAIFGKLAAHFAGESQGFYADAGQVADEALTLIRVVMSFGTYEREVARCVTTSWQASGAYS